MPIEMKARKTPKKISRPVLKAYARFLASELSMHRHYVSLIEGKLKILKERGILEDGVADGLSQDDLMRCKITEI